MLEQAEIIVRNNHPEITHMAVISGVGAREYYRKRGYTQEGTYMKKSLQG